VKAMKTAMALKPVIRHESDFERPWVSNKVAIKAN